LDYFVDENDVVLDIGCWCGPVSLYAAHLASKVYSIDPDPVVFALLEKNVQLNPDVESKIKCRNVAISEKNANMVLYARSKYGEFSSSLLPRVRDNLSESVVRGITLMSFVESEKIEKVTFIKMDVEGGEFLLLPSLCDCLEQLNFPTLYVSFHYDHLREHQYYLKIKWKFVSKLFMKLENWFGFDFFRKRNAAIILRSIQNLKSYRFIYDGAARRFTLLMNWWRAL